MCSSIARTPPRSVGIRHIKNWGDSRFGIYEDFSLGRVLKPKKKEFTDDLSVNTHMNLNRVKAIQSFGSFQRFLTSKSVPLGIRTLAYKALWPKLNLLC
jgi:hypothetical protein